MTDTPAGYRKDQQGRLIALEQIKPIDLARDDLACEIAARARVLSEVIKEFKAKTFADITAFVALSAEQYGVHLGGSKGNVTLLSFDGKFRVQRAIAESISFDERLQAAKVLIDECLNEWTKDARSEVRTLVQDAFRVDQQGNIRTAQVLGLRRLDIQDQRWLRAMIAIGEAVQVVGSKSYVRIYERDDDSGQYRAIPLDVAGA